MFAAPLALTVAAVIQVLAPPLPDPLQAGWKGRPVCERLLEDEAQRVLRCTFPPGTGHERHTHRPHYGYALSGGRMRISDPAGTRESVLATGSGFSSAGVLWHEVLNVGDTTVQYLIVEPKGADGAHPVAAPFVGVWDLVSIETHWPDGRVSQPWGAHPVGRLSYDADGGMSVVMMHEERNLVGRDEVPSDLRDEEAGYFGAYTVDPKRGLVFHHVAASLRKSESGVIERAYEFKDEALVFTITGKGPGTSVRTFQTWKRRS